MKHRKKSHLAESIDLLSRFNGPDLTCTLRRIESAANGVTIDTCGALLVGAGAGREMLTAAADVKRVAGQINAGRPHARGAQRAHRQGIIF